MDGLYEALIAAKLSGGSGGGGGGGTDNYNELDNKPQINSVTLSGNKSLADLGIQAALNSDNKLPAASVSGLANVATSGSYNDLSNKPTIPSTAADVGALADTTKYAGAASAGGSATSAAKLDNSAGSATQPVYFANGVPTATNYSLEKSVPSNAVFTDTTYAFEGTYDATTNKAATMADIKDGLLTGYAQGSGNVSATDKVAEAIGKVEKKADDNKNNISSLYDGGAKNIWSGAVNGTINGWRETFTGNIPKGNYIISFTNLTSNDTDSDTCQVVAVSGTTVVSNYSQCPRGNNVHINLALDSDADKLWIYSSSTSGGGAGDTATFTGLMICTPAAYTASSAYVPYSPTNAELYALIMSYHSTP